MANSHQAAVPSFKRPAICALALKARAVGALAAARACGMAFGGRALPLPNPIPNALHKGRRSDLRPKKVGVVN